ncbi:hypothetical protein QQ020_07440 [Fulvivirgaceae bacterium BMA12]|uniref:Uncharacterized protein n=1 Tax=Agaribacillus aureus TaxID=3051825 RepID=A0ABT8L6M2_9BACT|nr:hypothetical protein [Fulvivirgaceae bacterium BMA12]
MNQDKFKRIKEKFFESTLSSEEELRFKNLLSESKDMDDEVIQSYFKLIEDGDGEAFTPISKAQFFAAIDSKNRKRRHRIFRIAISAAAVVILLVGYLVVRDQQAAKRLSQAEIDRSLETTRLALASFSKYFDKGLEKIDEGVNFSRPFESLSKIDVDEIKNEK